MACLIAADTPQKTKGKARLVADQTTAKNKGVPATQAKGDAAKGKKALEAMKALKAAVDSSEAKPESIKSAALDSRPAKKITAPTITPAEIDSLLNKAISEAKAPVARLTSDDEFARRTYLDLTGRLPQLDELRSFVASRDQNKRDKLVASLLKTDDYATNWARYWRDVIRFRAPNEAANQLNYPSFEAWLSGQFAKNRPWDEIVTDILMARGPNTENGATVFALAQTGAPVEMAGEVSRVFMGVQIQCAQCHDHPNDSWKRQQFHEFAAFFSGIRAGRISKQVPGMPAVFGVSPDKRAAEAYTMPDLKDPTKSHPITPKFFLGDKATPVSGLKTAQRYALVSSLITGQDNPWFAKAYVNRVWGALMGEGFYTPIDDIGPTKNVHNGEVIDALAAQWQAGGYDVQWLFRTIMATKAYQRESRSTSSAAGRTPFASNCPSRLRADQIFDSISAALGLNLDVANRPGGGKKSVAVLAKTDAKTKPTTTPPAKNPAAQRNALRTRFNQTFGVDPSTPGDDIVGTIPQALFLMNSPQLNNAMKATNNSMLGQLLKSTPDNRAVLNALYLRVLARQPNAKEVQVCGQYVEKTGNREEAFEDILWSLLNSTEFISRR
jgi:hypothetical protein